MTTPAAPLNHADRQALGLNARKQLARSEHGNFLPAACKQDPLQVLRASMAGRVPRLIPIRYERMAASPFGFFRGAVPIMAADLSCFPNTGITTQLCGDAHVLNLGAYAALDGRLVFDINDFDETIRGPFEYDVKRLATSLLLAGRAAGIKRSARRDAVLHFTQQYRTMMHTFAAMPVLEIARYQIHRLGATDPMPAILSQASRSTPQKMLKSLTEPAPALARPTASPAPNSPTARIFHSNPPLLERLDAKEAALVLAALGPYTRTLQPERVHFLRQYSPQDIAFKVVGTGSVALRDYVIYFEGLSRPHGVDPLFLQIKEEPASAYAPYLPEGSGHTHEGHRVVDGQRAMQLTSDPFLGYTTIEGRDFLVRQLNDHKASLDLEILNPASLLGFADICGEMFARGHARAGDPVTIAAYLGTSDRFDRAILSFARAYADKTERDWEALLKSKDLRDAKKAMPMDTKKPLPNAARQPAQKSSGSPPLRPSSQRSKQRPAARIAR
ncbi:MAG TPA: DUF2252 domain-containing protein [Acidobacteriaceae bacterium]|nr:DUF2252 domain-containing protein [Acidobacteriaceae bacterium]